MTKEKRLNVHLVRILLLIICWCAASAHTLLTRVPEDSFDYDYLTPKLEFIVRMIELVLKREEKIVIFSSSLEALKDVRSILEVTFSIIAAATIFYSIAACMLKYTAHCFLDLIGNAARPLLALPCIHIDLDGDDLHLQRSTDTISQMS